MFDLSKAEYEVLFYFYNSNESLTKNDLLEMVPSLNKNTVAVVITNLLEKGYLEIADIRYSTKVLARAYSPCMPILEFLENGYGEGSVEKLVKHAIDICEDPQELKGLLDRISVRKNFINNSIW